MAGRLRGRVRTALGSRARKIDARTRRYATTTILAYFTRPTRSINHRLIGEIRTEAKHKAVRPASSDELDAFLDASWPEIDHDTGLNIRGDELLLKAREAMIAAVHIFNSAGLTFARSCSSLQL